MSHFLRPLLRRHQETVLVNERTGALLAAVVETAFDSATRVPQPHCAAAPSAIAA